MTEHDPQSTATGATADRPSKAGDAVVSPAGSLVRVVGFWGGGTALLAIAIAWKAGVSDASAIASVTVFAAAAAGLTLLASLAPRPMARWAFPVLGAQMLRTLLAPALGLAVYFLVPTLLPSVSVEPKAFWLTLLAVAAAMLVGETVAVSKMFGSAGTRSNRDAAAGREAVA